MSHDPGWRYWMDDDGGGFFDNGGGDDGSDDQDQDGDQGYNGDDDQDDQDQGDQGPPDGGGDGDDDLDEAFSDPDSLIGLDDDTTLSASDFPNASETDFQDDYGAWTPDDYQQSAQNLFGDHEFFGDTMATQRADEGYSPFADAGFLQGFEQIAPGSSETVSLFERDGQLHAFGFLPAALLAYLSMQYTGIDFSNVDVSVPQRGEVVQPQPLPPAFDSVEVKDAVDLRKYCSPVGDQGQTSRCAAFAWTHATEMVSNLKTGDSIRLSPSYSMLEIQRMQGDAQDYEYAYTGGDGAVGGPDPGRVLSAQGTCRQELWPDNSPAPATSERTLISDAERHRLEATPLPIALEDVRKVLSAGCPVQVSMNTGPPFSNIGRDGIFNAAEPPSGRHGRHAMLITGYTGNFFTVKNSWGEDWGDKGYCYIPKSVLADSDPEFIAALVRRD
jgi:hypothetical protein